MGSRNYKSLIAASGMAVCLAGAALAGCSDGEVALRGDFGEARFTVSVADTADERAQGLMFVEEMGPMEGMLFVYARPQSVSFWMRNTLIPLDMVFVDETGVVRDMHAMAQPLDETPISGGDGIQFVLEINGGMAARLGIGAGDEMQHPAFGANAVWPCAPN